MEILKELSRALNFSYYLHEANSPEYGNSLGQSSNESVSELKKPEIKCKMPLCTPQDELMGSMTYRIPYRVVELVQDNDYLLAAVAATIDEPHKKRFNYTQPISVQKYTFILRQPDEVSRIYLFTAPFTLETWGCLVGIILLTAPMLYGINRLVPLQELQIKGLSSVKSCFWYISGALLQQGQFPA